MVTPAEIQTGYDRLKQLRWVNYWILPSLDKALELREKLSAGLKCEQGRSLKKLAYGEALENVENAVYGMKVGQLSEPIKIDSQYYIFKLLKSQQDPKYANHDVGYYRQIIVQRIQDKESTYRLSAILRDLMARKGYDVEPAAYKYVLSQLSPVVFDRNLAKEDRGQSIQQELLKTTLTPGEMNERPLVVFKDGRAWTVQDVWAKLAVCPYPLNYSVPKDLDEGLLQVIDKLVLFDSITKDAVDKGYSDSHYVRYQTEMWSNSLLEQALLGKLRQSLPISEDEVRAFYDSTKDHHLQPERRKIISLIVPDKKLAEKLYRDLQKGADILALAKKYSKNKLGLYAKNPGVFITRNEWGNIGKTAFKMELGDVSSPQKVEDSAKSDYGIVKLVEIKTPSPYPYSEIHHQLYAAYRDAALQKYVANFLLGAVNSYNVKVDRSLLASVPYAGGSMVVMKTHFPIRLGAPPVQFFNPPSGLLPPGWKGLNSPMLAEWYSYAQTAWFKD